MHDCAITTHQYHKINFTSNIIDREKDEIKAKVEEVKSKQTDSSQLHDKVVNEKARIDAQKNLLTSEIDDFINAQISTLEKVRSNLKDEVISDYEKRNKQLDCHEDFLSIFIANCNSCVKFAERVCQAGPGNEVEVLSLKREIMPRLSHLATMQDVLFEKVIVTFNVDEDFWKSVTEKASFERVTVDPQQCVVTMGTGAEPGIIYSTFAKQRIHFSVAVNDSKKQRYDAPASVEDYVQKGYIDWFTSSDLAGPVIPLNVVIQFYDDGYGYEFTYTPPDEGFYQLSVTVNGEHVRGSPFQLSRENQDKRNVTPLIKNTVKQKLIDSYHRTISQWNSLLEIVLYKPSAVRGDLGSTAWSSQLASSFLPGSVTPEVFLNFLTPPICHFHKRMLELLECI
ncbi:predicted protein [Nematostella vectensis]|uniref:Uncharacterized protein n=1 Tax=Nematostella vectensis TaxID=45351 RepID=A7ST72_NEMVE|nr:predicted protein [Nematostella vectensis]|eukprot:XP_001625201.1 predicted protein [Nematostella vectensis]